MDVLDFRVMLAIFGSFSRFFFFSSRRRHTRCLSDWSSDVCSSDLTGGDHYGFMVAGKFLRGGHRGGGNIVNSLQRDRTRAIQLMQQAHENTGKENDKAAVSNFYLQFANLLMTGAGYADAWRL